VRRTRAPKSIIGFSLGVALLWVLFVPLVADRGLGIDLRPPVGLLVVLMLLAVTAQMRWTLAPWLRWTLAVLILVLAALQLATGGVAHVLDRSLDLYFDLRHVPNLLGLYLGAAGWRGMLVVIAAALGFVVLLWLMVRALAAIERAAVRPAVAMLAFAVGLIGLLLILLPLRAIDTAAATNAADQALSAWRTFAVLHGLDHRYDAALDAPQPPTGPLAGLKGKDVYLIFVESFGTVTLDDPGYRAILAPALADFAATTQSAGYTLLSNRLVSPVFGGGSWLAHGTIASGIKLDPLLNELVLNGNRKSLPRYLKAAGYRTVEVMPGIKQPDPEAAFWGFDQHYFAAQLGYAGPEFGWFDIPDQYTLAQFGAHELGPDHKPLFAQVVLVSSHTPFAPVPPYLDDWRDAGDFKTVPAADWPRIYAPPDWNDLDRPYLDSVAYDLKTVGAWLKGLDRDALVIILGDHQPPEITRVAGQPWTVPVYVLSRDADLVQPFAAHGYTPGDTPPARDDPEGMEKFLDEFLAGFSGLPSPHAAAPPQSPGAPAVSQP